MFFANVVDSKSVYVKNVSRYFTEADLEIEFNKYGRLVPDGVAIRSHKVFCMDIMILFHFLIFIWINLFFCKLSGVVGKLWSIFYREA